VVVAVVDAVGKDDVACAKRWVTVCGCRRREMGEKREGRTRIECESVDEKDESDEGVRERTTIRLFDVARRLQPERFKRLKQPPIFRGKYLI